MGNWGSLDKIHYSNPVSWGSELLPTTSSRTNVTEMSTVAMRSTAYTLNLTFTIKIIMIKQKKNQILTVMVFLQLFFYLLKQKFGN